MILAPKGSLTQTHLFKTAAPRRLGVAVSGGGDSLALLHFMVNGFRSGDVALEAVTVDHGLRPEAATEATFVAQTCAALGVPHTILQWTGWDGSGNLQAAARTARYGLIANWASEADLDGVAIGHTADDQAETVLMNFARGSGVDGLCGMPPGFTIGSTWFFRPLLGVPRDDLRTYLSELGQTWIDDPSNNDPRFARVRARQLLSELGGFGLSRERLLTTASRMQDARQVLARQAQSYASEITLHAGDILLPAAIFRDAPAETRNRLLASLLCTLSGQTYRPRFRPLVAMASGLGDTYRGVLHGCYAASDGSTVRLTREAAALDGVTADLGTPWDDRFRLAGPSQPGDQVRAFGKAAVGHLPGDRDATIPRQSLAASPAIWRNGEMIAAPLAGVGEGWTCEALLSKADILSAMLTT